VSTRTSRLRSALFFLLVPLLLLSLVPQAHAALVDHGPVKATPPGQGFPEWYRDTAGTQLELNVGPVNSFFSPIEQGSPQSAARGFGEEAFYWSADSTATLNGGRVATLRLALEATARQNAPAVAYRVRIVGDAPVAGEYKITHPYGVQTVFATAGAGGLNFNSVSVTPGFDLVLPEFVGPFLKSTTAPVGFLGDAKTATTVTGSMNGNNFFRIDGPAGSNIGGPGVDFVQTKLFAVQGKVIGAVPDATPPTLTHAFSRAVGRGTVTISGLDLQSGFSHLAYQLDRKPVVMVAGGFVRFSFKAGKHTLTFWGFDSAGNKSVVQKATMVVRAKPALTMPKVTPASPRRNRTFRISGKIGSADSSASTVSFVIERRVGGKFRKFKTVKAKLAAGKKTFSVKTRINRAGTFRVRAKHATDVMHVSGVSKFRTFRVR